MICTPVYPTRHSRGVGNPVHASVEAVHHSRAHHHGTVTWMPTSVGMTELGTMSRREHRAQTHRTI